MSALARQHEAINLSQGFPDFGCDPKLLELANKYMQAGFNQYAPKITQEKCNSLNKKIISKLDSSLISENTSLICFYETNNSYTSLNACIEQTKKLKNPYNHDDALFYCYQQFQEKMTLAECLKTSKKMIFPTKQDYLAGHCYERDY